MTEDRKRYHHGNLRQALVDATVDLIAEMGPQAFTLAEAARRAGVSAAAPYRHFKGRDDLIDEVAHLGFLDLAARLKAAFDDGRPNALAAFMRMGLAYLDFARHKPGHYQAMFSSGHSTAGNLELGRAADEAMNWLIRASEALFQHMPPDERPPSRMVANHVFALSHGVVGLFLGDETGGRSPISPVEMLESGTLIYLRGLGLLKN